MESTLFSNAVATLSLIASLVLGIFAIRQSAKANKAPLLCFRKETTPVIGFAEGTNLESRIRVEFDGKAIKRLSVAEIIVWNAGNAVLDGGAITLSDSIRVEVPDAQRILDAQIILSTSPGCDLSLSQLQNSKSYSITFNYLNPGDGCVISVLHTAESQDIDILGSLKGVQIEDEFGGPDCERTFEQRKKYCLMLTKIGWGLLFSYALLSRLSGQQILPPGWIPVTPENYLTLLIFLTSAPLAWWAFFPGVRRHSIPKSLQRGSLAIETDLSHQNL